MIPTWLHDVSIAALLVGAVCFAVIAVDVARHPQHMGVMNLVWPITALFGTVITMWGYFRYGSLATQVVSHAAMQRGEAMPSQRKTPFPVMVGKGSSHCGSGCTLGDICAEWLMFFVPVIAVWFGWNSLFQERMYAVWIVDFLLAFAFGIAFQYFTIKPMRNLSVRQGLWQALKADTLSLCGWQIGIYGFMAFASLYLFCTVLGARLEVNMVEFWIIMQIAMICGFITSYPVNWWLIRRGIKEKM